MSRLGGAGRYAPLPILGHGDARAGSAGVSRQDAARPAHDPTPGWAEARSILAVRLDSMGDVLMTTPALRALRESAPGRRITLLTSPAGAGIAELVPVVDDVIVYEAPWLKATPPGAMPATDLAMVEDLRRRRFDAAVIFTVYSQNPLPSAFLCHLAGIPLRLAHCRENPYQLLTDRVPEVEPEQSVRHEVRRQLDLVAAVGATTSCERLALEVPPDAADRVDALLADLGLRGRDAGGRPWALVHAGASAPSRRYPPELLAEAARGLVRELDCAVVLTGSRDEVPLVDEVRSAMGVPSASLAGRLSLAQLAAVIQAAPLLVAGNTGPVHVAAALGTPVVDIYALTNPQHTPWAVPSRVLYHDVPCRDCYSSVCPMVHHDCLRLVDPASVVAAAGELLGEGRSAPGVVASGSRPSAAVGAQ